MQEKSTISASLSFRLLTLMLPLESNPSSWLTISSMVRCTSLSPPGIAEPHHEATPQENMSAHIQTGTMFEAAHQLRHQSARRQWHQSHRRKPGTPSSILPSAESTTPQPHCSVIPDAHRSWLTAINRRHIGHPPIGSKFDLSRNQPETAREPCGRLRQHTSAQAHCR